MIDNVENITDEELKIRIDNFYKEIKSRDNLDDFYNDVKAYLDELYNYYLNLNNFRAKKYFSTQIYISEYRNLDRDLELEYLYLEKSLKEKIEKKAEDILNKITDEKLREKLEEIYSLINTNPILEPFRKIITKVYDNYMNLTYDKIKELILNDTSEELSIHNLYKGLYDLIDESIENEKLEELENIEFLPITTKFVEMAEKFDDILKDKTYNKFEKCMLNIDIDSKKAILEKYNIEGIKGYLNELLTNIDVDFARKIINEYDVSIIEYIPENVFKKLNSSDLEAILEKSNKYDVLSLLSNKKRKIIIESLGLVKTLSMIEANSARIQIYKIVEDISYEELEDIINNELYYGIENCKKIYNNREYLKKIINTGYQNIICNIEDKDLDEELINLIKEKILIKDSYQTIDRKLYFSQIQSDKIFDILTEKSYNIDYKNLISKIPRSKLTIEKMLKCILLNRGISYFSDIILEKYKELAPYLENNGNNLNELGVKYLIDRNIKLSSTISLSNNELNYFLKNGQTYLIDLVEENLTRENLELAVRKGYIFTTNSPIEKFPPDTFKKFYDEGHYDVIIPYSLSIEYINEVANCIIHSGYSSIFKFAEEKGLDTNFCDDFIINKNSRILRNFYADYQYLLDRYANEPVISQYVKVLFADHNILNIIKTKEDIYKYFDEEGPKRELYDIVISNDDNDLFDYLFRIKNANWKKRYDKEEDKPIISYIEFLKNNNIYSINLIKEISDINKYFDAAGPTRALYDKTLINEIKLFNKLFSEDNWKKQYNKEEDKPIVSYVEFLNKHGLYPTATIQIHHISDINKYFDAEGPTRALYDETLIANKLLFNKLFNDDTWKIKYNKEEDAPIISYINYIKDNHNCFVEQIKKISDINKYFDEKGPTRTLYDEAILKNRQLFDRLFKDDSWKKYYNSLEDISIISYINFLKNNPTVRPIKYINSLSDISKYFNESGPTRKLYDSSIFFEELWSDDIARFNILFNGDDWEKYYIEEKDAATVTYIKFIKKYGHIFNSIVKNESDVLKYFNEFGYTEELKEYFRENPHIADKILTSAVHNDLVLDNLTTDFVNMFECYLIDKYFSTCEKPKEKYEYLLKNIGPEILFNFGNINILRMIRTNKSDLDKFFNLFPDTTTMTKQDTYTNIIASLIDYKFKKEHKDIVEVFTNMRTLIENISEEELRNQLNKLPISKEKMDNSISTNSFQLHCWINNIINKLNYDEVKIEELKNAILNYKNNNETNQLHEICKTYLIEFEKEYDKNNRNRILLEFGIKPTYDNDDIANAYSDYLLKNITYDNYISIKDKYYELLNDNSIKGYEKLKALSNEQFDLIINSIKNKEKPDDSVKQEFGILKKFISKISKFYIENNLISENELHSLNLTSTQPVMKLEKLDIIKILSELDFDVFIKYANDNPKVLENLTRIIRNYGLGRLPNSMKQNFEYSYSLKLPGGINNIGTFITKYNQLLENKRKNLIRQGKNISLENVRLSFTEVVELISLSNSETYELKRLLGSSAYYDFAANKAPNGASYDRIKREEYLGKIVDYLYTLDSITIPSKDTIIESEKTKKKVNFIVGNRTNPSNICHGERTGACMRVGGVGEGLFLKCLTDKNWFHIRIEDPITHEYVSRVSGFRNGNTVYLNQLRDVAAGTNYTNQDLQEYIKIYAQQLIEETKNSEYPVENVFINSRYAMQDFEAREYTFGNKIQSEYNLNGVMDLRLNNSTDIWTDVRNKALLLATTEEGKKTYDGYAPLKNGPDNAEIYKVVRDKIYGFECQDENIPRHCFVEVGKEELIEKVNRVHAMREKLSGKDYRYDIDDEIIDDIQIKDGYASSDWFVYLDSDNNIHKEYISEIEEDGNTILYHQAEEAKTEMEYYTEILTNKYNLAKEVSYAV